MSLVELPRAAPPRVFVAPPPGLERRIRRALDALGDLPDDFLDLPGFADFTGALIALADALDGDPDLEEQHDVENDPAEWGVADWDGLHWR